MKYPAAHRTPSVHLISWAAKFASCVADCLPGLMIFVVCVVCQTANAQSGEWIWTAGSNSLQSGQSGYSSAPGVYGTLGSAASGNIPGGRASASSWADQSGNLWLFGGIGADGSGTQGYLNDLWRFNASNGEWVWIAGSSSLPGNQLGVAGSYGTAGVAAAANSPGGRKAALAWTDANGDLWLFGGFGFDSTGSAAVELNDLWRFNLSTNLWTWMAGSSIGSQPGVYGTLGVSDSGNSPGGRDSAIGWVDASGNLWLFGGYGLDSSSSPGLLNDLWEFTPNSQWTWKGGTASANQPGVYGSLSNPSAANIPGGRRNAAAWTDNSENFWLFGGTGLDSSKPSVSGELNDLWRLNFSTLEWTWMGGSSVLGSSSGQPGIYGTLGEASSSGIPGGRDSSATWTDSNGNLWLFGGHGYDSTDYPGELNDLWMFTPSTHQWSWQGGSSVTQSGTYNCYQGTNGSECGQVGVYGTLGTPAASNISGGRESASSWADDLGNLWLFGGAGFDSAGHFGNLNDLWQLMRASTAQTADPPTFSPGSGTYTSMQTVTITDSTPGETIYFTTDGTTPTTNSTLYTGAVSVSSSETLQALAVASGYANSAVASATYVLTLPAAAPTFSPGCGSYSSAQRVTLSDSTPGAVLYYTVDSPKKPALA